MASSEHISRKLEVIGRFTDGRVVYRVPADIPSVGYIAFGVIDRGTNVLQVRPTTICPQNCIFCSVDAGLRSTHRWAEYIVDPGLVINGVAKAVEEKGCTVEILLDTIGDVLTYPYLVELIKALKKIGGVRYVALETHGMLLTRKLVDRLAEAGLDRINFSIETLNPEKARYLYGTPGYDLKRVLDAVEYAVKETPVDLHVTPVLLPGINEEDIVEVINWALKIGAGKRWPPVTVQKFNKHKYGRGKSIREMTWSEFWKYLEDLEKKVGTRLRWAMEEWGMSYARRIKSVARKGDVIDVEVIGRGWLKGEFLGIYGSKALVTVSPGKLRVKIGGVYTVEIVEDKDNLYIARALREVRA